VPANQPNNNSQKNSGVLITGGSGIVGRYLTSLLLSEGYKVSVLSRNADHHREFKVLSWDPENKIIDPSVFEGIDYIIHLAGANIGEKRWSVNRKKEIISSRSDSASFLHKAITDSGIHLKAFITASATGYYGSVTSDKIFTEKDPPSKDFLGTTCRLWEQGADLFRNIGVRTVKIRTAVVLEKSDSALTKLMKPARYGFVVRTGNGQQYFPWIHIKDLCNIYLMAIEDPNINGAYNAVAPEHVNHNDFVRTMALVMNRPVFLPPVPAFILKAIMGEMSVVILEGSCVSSEKIIKAGYKFIFGNLNAALENVING